jgi:hypothetical protein
MRSILRMSARVCDCSFHLTSTPTPRRARSFCYVEFSSADAVANALILNGTKFRDREIRVTAKRTNVPFHLRSGGAAGSRGGRGGADGGSRGFRGRGGSRGGRGAMAAMMGAMPCVFDSLPITARMTDVRCTCSRTQSSNPPRPPHASPPQFYESDGDDGDDGDASFFYEPRPREGKGRASGRGLPGSRRRRRGRQLVGVTVMCE